jgi:hypothetical protein
MVMPEISNQKASRAGSRRTPDELMPTWLKSLEFLVFGLDPRASRTTETAARRWLMRGNRENLRSHLTVHQGVGPIFAAMAGFGL